MTNLDLIDEEYLRRFFDRLIQTGITIEKKILDPSLLTNFQKSQDREKVLQIIEDIKNNRYVENDHTLYNTPVIATNDNTVMHGTNRLYAHRHLKMDLPAYVFNLNTKEFVDMLINHEEYPLYKDIIRVRDIRIGKIFYSLLEEVSSKEAT